MYRRFIGGKKIRKIVFLLLIWGYERMLVQIFRLFSLMWLKQTETIRRKKKKTFIDILGQERSFCLT